MISEILMKGSTKPLLTSEKDGKREKNKWLMVANTSHLEKIRRAQGGDGEFSFRQQEFEMTQEYTKWKPLHVAWQ